jgi:hypothetical protein
VFPAGQAFPAGHVLHTQSSNIDSTDGNAVDTSYTSTGNTITVVSANAALGSKIKISFTNNFWLTYTGIEARISARVQRTAPSASTIFESSYMGTHTGGISCGFLWSGTTIDESLGSGDHVYQVQYKKHTASTVFYLGLAPSKNKFIIQVIK